MICWILKGNIPKQMGDIAFLFSLPHSSAYYKAMVLISVIH